MIVTGPYYTGKGGRYGRRRPGLKPDSITVRMNYIELPVQLTWLFPAENENNFHISGGFYTGYGFAGKIVYKGSPERTIRNIHRKENPYKRWDFGYNLQMGYRWQDRRRLCLEYSNSIINTSRSPTERNFVLNLSLSCFLQKRNWNKGCQP